MNQSKDTTPTKAAVAIVADGGYSIGYADRDVPGYTPTTYTCDSYEEAAKQADLMNEAWGVSKDLAMDIVASSMRGDVS